MKYFSILIVLVVASSLYNCARVGRPTGGDKDILPPIVISATPDFGSINYTGKKIKISFDEYIKFENLNQELIISPPLKYTPEITPLGFPSKHITITIKDTLKNNTTYTFNFGNAIIDNSEGNPLKQFKYLFSTGNYIDSLQISGYVKDAFLKDVESDISILLYRADSTYNDSIVYKIKPNYVAKTMDSIGFSITNIKNGDYYLFALKDENKNLLFDPREDKIAFLKAPIPASKDTTYALVLFKEQASFSIKSVSEISKNHIVIGYEGFIDASVDNVLDKNNKTVSFLSFKDKQKDSIHIWHKNSDSDSLFINIRYKDSISTYTQRMRSKDIDSLQLSLNIKNILQPRDSLQILSNIPIVTINTDKIKLIDKDSVEVPFKIISDKIDTKLVVDFDKKENDAYTLSILPAAFTDFLEQKNDSLQYFFKTKSLNDYGKIVMTIKTDNNTPLIIELISSKGKLLAKEYLKNEKELVFNYLEPGKYRVRAIYDDNENKRWDSGNFIRKIQPERVLYYPKDIEVRANWSISEIFDVE